ncbi:DUF397 domain-containing protein [Streptomyces sp. NPDC001185]|uniref:DUF397 domain-containing protein n=1 Tax=Streptomyces sp. NPDC001185 TaxID=3154380 RepID=UPI003323C02E
MNAAPSLATHAPDWFTSSYSNGAGGECVACARGVDGVLVRDSKERGGPVVAFRSAPWRSFIDGVEGIGKPGRSRGLAGARWSAIRPR